MVMKRNAMRTNLRQSILKSLGRYIAIAMIIALGAAIFVGLRMTKADMVATGQVYTDKQNMFDLRLMTSYGWNREHVDRVRQLEGVTDAEGLFYTDLIARQGNAEEESVYRFYTMPQRINQLVLLGGRMPEAANECLADGYRVKKDILGTQVTISETNSEDSLEILNETTFTIVGYVSTPLYMDMNRGTTSVGNGSLANYFFVPEEAFDVDYFTEIHITIPGDYAIYSDEYNDAMEAMAEQLESPLQDIADDRLHTVVTDAEEAYTEGYEEYMDGLREYYDGFHQAHEELRDGYEKLKEGEQELADNEQLLIDGQQQIDDARIALKEGKKTLEESKKTLATTKAAAYKQLSQQTQDLMLQLQKLTGDQSILDTDILKIDGQILELNGKILPLETEKSLIDSEIGQKQSMISILDITIESARRTLELAEQSGADEGTLSDLREDLQKQLDRKDSYEEEIAQLNGKKADLEAELAPLYAQRDALEAEKAQLESSSDSLADTIASITESMMELVVTQTVMEKEFAAADAQIEAAEAQIEAGALELDIQEQNLADGWILLEEGKQELADGWEEYHDGAAEAKAELLDARKKLAEGKAELVDAREMIDGMTEITPIILDRNSNIGYGSLDSSSDIVAGVSKVFPAFFLLVAALVCITTMTRMVDEERTQIGTLKALGYSNGAIMSKYLFYAGSSAVLGCGLGVFAGSAIFPMILWEAYKIMLFIQDNIVLTFDIGLCLLVVGMYTAVELAVTWYCCRRALEEVPAELIRPKAPEAGKQLIFERLPIWHKVSFLNKVTIRNIFRYRQRLAMMLVGIGGCTALLVTGYGLRDSIVNVVDYQFEEVTTYDLQVYFAEHQTVSDRNEFVKEVSDRAEATVFYHQSSIELEFDHNFKELYLIAADEQVQQVIDFHSGEEALPMPRVNEVLLSVGVAEAMGIETGDSIIMRNADMDKLSLTVSGIYDNHVENYAIILPETIEAQWGSLPDIQMAFLKLHEDQDPHLVTADLSDVDGVMNVSVSADLADMVSRMMEALDLVVVVIVFCAALLAVTVLYNLTNININERIREIATIKVLGFNASETAAYVFKENMTLTVVGSIVGLFLGNLLLAFVMSNVKIDMVWFKAIVMPMSYVWSIVLTLLSAIVVDFVFFFKLDTINMAEALKSVE